MQFLFRKSSLFDYSFSLKIECVHIYTEIMSVRLLCVHTKPYIKSHSRMVSSDVKHIAHMVTVLCIFCVRDNGVLLIKWTESTLRITRSIDQLYTIWLIIRIQFSVLDFQRYYIEGGDKIILCLRALKHGGTFLQTSGSRYNS